MNKLIVILLLGGILTGCSPYCEKNDVINANAKFIDVYIRFGMQVAMIRTNKNESTIEQVNKLNQFIDEAKSISSPACLSSYKKTILSSMQNDILSVSKLVDGEVASAMNFQVIASSQVKDATAEYQRIEACLPNCKP